MSAIFKTIKPTSDPFGNASAGEEADDVGREVVAVELDQVVRARGVQVGQRAEVVLERVVVDVCGSASWKEGVELNGGRRTRGAAINLLDWCPVLPVSHVRAQTFTCVVPGAASMIPRP